MKTGTTKPKTTVVIDTEQLGYHYDMIACPGCGDVQQAKILHTEPPTYMHTCRSCNRTITEKDWQTTLTI